MLFLKRLVSICSSQIMFRRSERSYGNTTRTPMTNDPAGRLTSIYAGDRDDRVNFEAIMHMETLSDDWHERDDRRLSLNRRWKRNHESWIIKVTKHIRIIKLYSFKNLGIMNLCTSARESRIIVTRLWEKLNKIHVWINCVLSRWCMIWRFRDSPQVSNFFSGAACPQISLYNSCIRDWQSACSVSYNLVFDVQLQKK